MESTQRDLDVNSQLSDTFPCDADGSDDQDPRQSAADTQERLKMDKAIDQLGVDSTELHAVRQMVCLTLHQVKLAPIDRVPVEILSTIFEFVRGRYLEPLEPSFDALPLYLMHVSSRWREIARATPGLWTHISSDFSLPLVDSYLRWSKRMPLHVMISLYNTPNDDLAARSDPIVQNSDKQM